MTLAHLLYIPLMLAIGIYIGRQIERHGAESNRKKREKLKEIQTRKSNHRQR